MRRCGVWTCAVAIVALLLSSGRQHAFAAELPPCERAAMLTTEARAIDADGRHAEAVTFADRASELCPGNPSIAAARSEIRRAAWDAEQKQRSNAWEGPRLELVGVQTVHGALQGAVLGTLLDDGTGPGTLVLGVGGAAAGLLTTTFLTRQGVRLVDTLVIDSATVWAVALTTAAAIGSGAPGGTEWILNVAGLAGAGAGALIAHFTDAEPGQVSFTNSAGLWMALSSMWATLSLSRATGNGPWFAFVGGGIGGLTAGALVSRWVHPTRLEMFLVDLGGVLGAAMGLGAAAAFGLTPSLNPVPLAIMPPAFTAGGLAAATMLVVSHRRAADSSASTAPTVAIVTGAPGSLAGASVIAAW